MLGGCKQTQKNPSSFQMKAETSPFFHLIIKKTLEL